ncbi:DUF6266 family protein [Halosquirtibacter xylanolyticus]|uniref:DUF6266 family protein n=1 Tax=Halosquirtibacter xylanolyticus TaxID=3374599 RepID=UPI00374A306D|nr:DUF6266 family protein [Prolixibacteraceae bacterium]
MARIDGKYFTGTIGNLVLVKIGNKQYVRSKPEPSKKPASEKQKCQRLRMKLASSFLSNFKDVIRVSYRKRSQTIAKAICSARSHVIMDAIGGEYPNLYIDCSKVRMSIRDDTTFGVDAVWYDGLHLTVNVDVEHNSIRDGYLVILRYGTAGGDISDMVKLRHREEGAQSDWQPYSIKWNNCMDAEEIHFWAMIYDPLHEKYSRSCYFSFYLAPEY